MAILNQDGTPYKAVGSLQQFDPENPEHNLFNLWDEEQMRIGGSPIFYYEVFIQKAAVDPIYHEDRSKLFSNHPIEIFGSYEPIQSQNYMNAFGVDSPDEMIFKFNYRAILRAIGHPPKIGSRLRTPHLDENWVIIQRNLGEFGLWGALRLEILAQRFQESTTTGEGRVTQAKSDVKIV
jgi:hypothetical protein